MAVIAASVTSTTNSSTRAGRGFALRALRLKLLPAVLFLLLWELAGRSTDALGIPDASATLVSLAEQLTSSTLWSALWASNQAMLGGYLLACLIGTPMGMWMGRRQAADRAFQPWVNLMLITPMAMLIPLIIMALGFGLSGRLLVVFLFVIPMVVINCRAGVRTVPTDLIDMAHSFGANERQVWWKVILPAASPAIFTGLRIGMGRAITGMVIVEWLLAAVGIGALLLQYRGAFQPDRLYAVVIIVLIESLLLISLLRAIERRYFGWSGSHA